MKLKNFFISGVIKAMVEDDLASGNKVGYRGKDGLEIDTN